MYWYVCVLHLSIALKITQISPGSDYKKYDIATPDPNLCQQYCAADPDCKAFSYVKPGIERPYPSCYLKNTVPPAKSDSCCISGVESPSSQLEISNSSKEKANVQNNVSLHNLDTRVVKDYLGKNIQERGKIRDAQKTIIQNLSLIFNRNMAISPSVQYNISGLMIEFSLPEGMIPLSRTPEIDKVEQFPKAPSASYETDIGGVTAGGYITIYGKNFKDYFEIWGGSLTSSNPTADSVKGSPIASSNATIRGQDRNIRSKSSSNPKPETFVYSNTTSNLANSSLQTHKVAMKSSSIVPFQAIFSELPKTDLPGGDYKSFDLANPDPSLCKQACDNDYNCQAYTYVDPGIKGPNALCYLKNTVPASVSSSYCTSGIENGSVGVTLEYTYHPNEFSTEKHYLNLTPYYGDWGNSWSYNWIKAKVPEIPETYLSIDPSTQKSFIDIGANLIVWKKGMGGFTLKVPIALYPGTGGISYIESPEFGDCAVSGQTMLIHGSGFGDSPGHIVLKLREPLKTYNYQSNSWVQVDTGLTEIGFTPASGDWKTSWRDDVIAANVDKLSMNFDPAFGDLYIYRANDPRPLALSPVKVEPNYVLRKISGKNFLEFVGQGGNNHAEAINGTLIVTHDPSCSSFLGVPLSSGNSGEDYFFSENKPLPPNCELVSLSIFQVPPNKEDVAVFLLENVGEMLNSFTDPVDMYIWLGKHTIYAIVGAIAGPGTGSYKCEITKPKDLDKPTTKIHWENTCYPDSDYNNVPIQYVASFQVRAPEAVDLGE